MSDKEKNKIIEELAIKLEEYVKIILKEYGDFIKSEDILRLKQITNYKDFIRVSNTGTISCFVSSNNVIWFPESVYKLLKILKLVPGNGINKKHKPYNDENIVINDNTFYKYMKHIFIKGANAKEFYEENLLHESMHFCGSGGGSESPLLEGLTEYRTRELAKKYNLKTTGCGYPKEVKIIEELEKIFDKKFLNIYLFEKGGYASWNYLRTNFGEDALNFFMKLEYVMMDEFNNKYYNKTNEFNGFFAALKKAKAYSELQYQEVHELIKTYKQNSLIKTLKKDDDRKKVVDIKRKEKQKNIDSNSSLENEFDNTFIVDDLEHSSLEKTKKR